MSCSASAGRLPMAAIDSRVPPFGQMEQHMRPAAFDVKTAHLSPGDSKLPIGSLQLSATGLPERMSA